jgi:hypothetical protein
MGLAFVLTPFADHSVQTIHGNSLIQENSFYYYRLRMVLSEWILFTIRNVFHLLNYDNGLFRVDM